ncbi:methyltransferase [Ancylobacter sp. 6x-1]|uniref:Methyltransferase n=1 Tax=Ancylobacter crimeensis TaxID=2579147 RepID=A0ABT0D8Z0_9HYPH|nr:protein-glutamate O-methyltransferase CheR [Ancylobacter crimeensis]MCK0196420.1 methyltransferase [Ancylobacter crimeensis]
MILGEVERLLQREIGLHVETVGSSVVHYALKQRMAALTIDEPELYWQRLNASRDELQELINAVVIPETWFFRDREAFTALAGHARAHRRTGLPFRVLSLPCSTGEEPYSAAMALFDAGLAAEDFRIDAMDVSTRNIAAARQATYGRNSFRGSDLSFRARYFTAVERGYRPSEAVRGQVHFRAGNLFEANDLPGAEIYDAVFCRNLLIYFDRSLQEKALDRLRALLVRDGLLLVGPAEASLPTLHGFVSARLPMAFAFLRQDGVPAASVLAAPPVPPARVRRPAVPAAPIVARRVAPRPFAPLAAKPVTVAAAAEDHASAHLAAIQRAADAGRLDEVKTLAQAHIERFGPEARVFYLLGLAHDAGDATSAAIENYRKALYLAPDDRETLAQLALLLQRQGDLAGARRLAGRLDRLEKGGPP